MPWAPLWPVFPTVSLSTGYCDAWDWDNSSKSNLLYVWLSANPHSQWYFSLKTLKHCPTSFILLSSSKAVQPFKQSFDSSPTAHLNVYWFDSEYHHFPNVITIGCFFLSLISYRFTYFSRTTPAASGLISFILTRTILSLHRYQTGSPSPLTYLPFGKSQAVSQLRFTDSIQLVIRFEPRLVLLSSCEDLQMESFTLRLLMYQSSFKEILFMLNWLLGHWFIAYLILTWPFIYPIALFSISIIIFFAIPHHRFSFFIRVAAWIFIAISYGC